MKINRKKTKCIRWEKTMNEMRYNLEVKKRIAIAKKRLTGREVSSYVEVFCVVCGLYGAETDFEKRG